MPGFIYGLSDPRTGAVRYIGQSTRRARLAEHGQHAALSMDMSEKGLWIKSLRAEGLNYEARILEAVPDTNDLPLVEQFWVAQAKGLGWPLLNMSRGGRGRGVGAVTSEAHRQNQAAVLGSPEMRAHFSRIRKGRPGKKGIRPSDATRRKMSLAQTGRSASRATRLKQSQSRGGKSFMDHFGNCFEMLDEASALHGIPRTTVHAILKGRIGRSRHGVSFRYVEGA